MRPFQSVGVGVLASALGVAGCGSARMALPSSQAPAVVSPASSASHGKSWMGKGLSDRTLLYVSNPNGTVNVYRYWQRTLVGVLTNFARPMGECADQSGDVYITDSSKLKIFEYAHGGTRPIDTIVDSKFIPLGCSVDPGTKNLAVANSAAGSYSPGNIAVYGHGSGAPTVYQGPHDEKFLTCSYDDHGNLFASAEVSYSSGFSYYTDFYYLPKHGQRLIAMDLTGPSWYYGWPYVPAVGWDGKYWVVEADGNLYRFSIGVKPVYVGEVTLTHGPSSSAIAFYRRNLKSNATQAVGGASGYFEQSTVAYWAYPAGENPLHTITKDLDSPFGAAISIGTGDDQR